VEIFPLPIEGVVRTSPSFKSPLPPFTKGVVACRLLIIDSTAMSYSTKIAIDPVTIALQPPNQQEASMKRTILYGGLDIDDCRHHGSALNKHTGDAMEFHCRPTLKGLVVRLTKLAKSFPGCSIRTCMKRRLVRYLTT